jgi:hypothetical protein
MYIILCDSIYNISFYRMQWSLPHMYVHCPLRSVRSFMDFFPHIFYSLPEKYNISFAVKYKMYDVSDLKIVDFLHKDFKKWTRVGLESC